MKNLLVLCISVICLHLTMKAQIQNPGFECQTIDSSICHWGTDFIIMVALDSNGVIIGDSIVFDQGRMIGSSNDAYTGNKAIELRNAWNFTQNKGYAGQVINSFDSIFSTYKQVIALTSKPLDFSFFYKYFPVGGDSAQAILTVFDSNMTQIGESKILIEAGAPNYTLAHNTVSYTSNDIPALATLRFSTAVKQIHFGTRLLVDEVSFNNPLGIDNIENPVIHFSPNPVKYTIYFNHLEDASIQILNGLGQTMIKAHKQQSIDVSHLPNGIYFLNILSGGKRSSHVLLKE